MDVIGGRSFSYLPVVKTLNNSSKNKTGPVSKSFDGVFLKALHQESKSCTILSDVVGMDLSWFVRRMIVFVSFFSQIVPKTDNKEKGLDLNTLIK